MLKFAFLGVYGYTPYQHCHVLQECHHFWTQGMVHDLIIPLSAREVQGSPRVKAQQ